MGLFEGQLEIREFYMLSALFVLAAVGVSGFFPLQAQQLFSDVPQVRRIFTLRIE